MKNLYVCVAGTFDRLHVGHEALLKKAFGEGDRVLIGLTSDKFVRSYKQLTPDVTIAPYSSRKQTLTNWLTKLGYMDRTTIVPIDDPFEPAVSSKDLEALVVSEASVLRAKELNTRREAHGLLPLVLIVVQMTHAEDQQILSSTRVRAGEVDTKGSLTMPDALRSELARPSGNVLSTPQMIQESFDVHKKDIIISVGDLTTKTILDAGIIPKLMIIDNKVERKAFFELQPLIQKRGFNVKKIQSGPGFISREAAVCIHTLLSAQPQGSSVIEVVGEEDLLALPVMAEATVGSIIYYGQPGRGIVEIVVTNETKNTSRRLLQQFVS